MFAVSPSTLAALTGGLPPGLAAGPFLRTPARNEPWASAGAFCGVGIVAQETATELQTVTHAHLKQLAFHTRVLSNFSAELFLQATFLQNPALRKV